MVVLVVLCAVVVDVSATAGCCHEQMSSVLSYCCEVYEHGEDEDDEGSEDPSLRLQEWQV